VPEELNIAVGAARPAAIKDDSPLGATDQAITIANHGEGAAPTRIRASSAGQAE